MTKTLFIVRGLPGSGKSWLARLLTINAAAAFAADDFFEKDGGYDFDPAKLSEAHQWCISRTNEAMAEGQPFVAVHNTFSKAWEAEPYYDLASMHGYTVFVIEAQNDFGNTHGVPDGVIEGMRERWEPLEGAPLPLWRVIRARWRKFKARVRGKTRRCSPHPRGRAPSRESESR